MTSRKQLQTEIDRADRALKAASEAEDRAVEAFGDESAEYAAAHDVYVSCNERLRAACDAMHKVLPPAPTVSKGRGKLG